MSDSAERPWITTLKPILKLLPEVEAPTKQVALIERCIWTLVTLLIYLIAGQIPLYGVLNTDKDYLQWLRTLMAANRGTLTELGMGPQMMGQMFTTVLSRLGVIGVNRHIPSERAALISLNKLASLGFTTIQASVQVYAGMYGPFASIGIGKACLIVAQLVFASLLVMLLSEILEKGWGLGKIIGASLFQTANVCEQIMSKTVSFAYQSGTERGTEYTGCLINLGHKLMTQKNWKHALHDAFFRSHLPNMTEFVCTVLLFGLIIFFHGMQSSIRLKKANAPGRSGLISYPIKLLSGTGTPALIYQTITTYFLSFSQRLFHQLGTSSSSASRLVASLVGTWEQAEDTIGSKPMAYPTGGLAYFITPPSSIHSAIMHPLHFLGYLVLTCICSAYLSKFWAKFQGQDVNNVRRELSQSGLMMPGMRLQMFTKVLSRYITPAIIVGGGLYGLITTLSGVCGCFGGGSGLFIATNTILKLYEEGMEVHKADLKERKAI
ncbi:Sec61-alpha [Aduncisulcus paluster]|uniref:Sec61-alpha n=1 Tax=Aduncisulcus paluster TaxID=2918883 RepID=A0ABQ5KQ25_9EUKA|nr:Sec61-alpha [Aduncisulcus paluster]